jgi:1,2-diacylglycerol 3-alpha-glucosyltransferase
MPAGEIKAAVVYHFFAHYRQAVLKELAKHPKIEWHLYGAEVDPTHQGIEAFIPEKPLLFHRTQCRYLGGCLFQSKVIGLALQRDISAIIYLGDAHYITTWISAALARITGKRVFFWTHGWTRLDQGMMALVRRVFYRLAHGLLLYGDRGKEIGRSVGFPANRLFPIYNSLDYETQKTARQRTMEAEIAAFRRELFANPDAALIVCPARVTTAQRYDLLIEAMLILKKKGMELNAVLIGDGPERERVVQSSREKGLNMVILPPCYDENKLRVYLMSADICVSPGKVGLTAMHALAYGTPVITHDNLDRQMPEVEAIRPGVNGLLFKEGDAEALAKTIHEWLSLPVTVRSNREAKFAIIEERYNPTEQARRIVQTVFTGITQ